jgi:hypothetical protein
MGSNTRNNTTSHSATVDKQNIEVIDNRHTQRTKLSNSIVPDQDGGVHNEIAVHMMHDMVCEAHGKPLLSAQPCTQDTVQQERAQPPKIKNT